MFKLEFSAIIIVCYNNKCITILSFVWHILYLQSDNYVTRDVANEIVTMKFLYYCTLAPTLSLVSETFAAEEGDGSVEVCSMLNVPLTFVLDIFIVASDIGSATDGT